MKVGNRTRDLLACSAVPQPTALSRACTEECRDKRYSFYDLKLGNVSILTVSCIVSAKVILFPHGVW
jgi:hypothetical protein